MCCCVPVSHARQDELRASAVELCLSQAEDVRVTDRVTDRSVRSRNVAVVGGVAVAVGGGVALYR